MWSNVSRKLFPTTQDPTLALARLILAAIFFSHGSQKMFGLFGGLGIQRTIEVFQADMGIPGPLTVLVMCTEVFGALALLLGLMSRVAALGIAAIMIVAPFANGLFPQFFMNWTGRFMHEGFEYHLLALALLIGIIVRGGGAWSIDRAIAGRAAAS